MDDVNYHKNVIAVKVVNISLLRILFIACDVSVRSFFMMGLFDIFTFWLESLSNLI